MKTFVISQNDCDKRLDKFLQKSVPLLPQSLMYRYIRTKRIKVNGKRSQISYRLKEADTVELYINDEFFTKSSDFGFLSVSGNIKVVYEDENILLVNKPQGLVVHEDNSNSPDTLINRVKRYLYDKKEYNPDDELSFAPALCNRIDRNTCGIVIVAKNAPSLRILNEKIKNRELTKKYLCIVVGTPPKKSDTLTNYLLKDSAKNTVKIYDKPIKDSKTIITKYTLLKTKGELSLLEVDLKTGRTHQIRAHLSYIGNCLLGDGKYGINAINKKYGLKHQALCAYKLCFNFKSDAEVLNYLNGKEFTIDDIWFVDEFFNKNN